MDVNDDGRSVSWVRSNRASIRGGRDRTLPVADPIGGDARADSVNPALSVISSGTPNANDATITWTTDILADSTVFWGLTSAYTGATSPRFDPTPVTSHNLQITGLVTATTYHYAVRSRSTVTGGYTTSNDATFLTA